MSTTLSSMLMKCLKPSYLYWWNVYNPIIYCDEMSTTLFSSLMKCLKPSSHQDPSMRTSMCGTSLVRRWSSRSPSHIRAGSPAWPGCQLISWLLSGMIMQSWLGISLARLWSDNGWWWWMMIMDDDDGWWWWLYVHYTEIVAIMTIIMGRWDVITILDGCHHL